jgi:general secretion pathway protein G
MLVRTTKHVAARSAFTLLEILVVVAIIVVLAGVGGYYLLPRVDEARLGVAKGQLRMLTGACDNYNLNNGSFPPNLQALAQQQPTGGMPLVEADKLVDPFGQPYGYDPSGSRNLGNHADIWINYKGQQIGNWPGSR